MKNLIRIFSILPCIILMSYQSIGQSDDAFVLDNFIAKHNSHLKQLKRTSDKEWVSKEIINDIGLSTTLVTFMNHYLEDPKYKAAIDYILEIEHMPTVRGPAGPNSFVMYDPAKVKKIRLLTIKFQPRNPYQWFATSMEVASWGATTYSVLREIADAMEGDNMAKLQAIKNAYNKSFEVMMVEIGMGHIGALILLADYAFTTTIVSTFTEHEDLVYKAYWSYLNEKFSTQSWLALFSSTTMTKSQISSILTKRLEDDFWSNSDVYFEKYLRVNKITGLRKALLGNTGRIVGKKKEFSSKYFNTEIKRSVEQMLYELNIANQIKAENQAKIELAKAKRILDDAKFLKKELDNLMKFIEDSKNVKHTKEDIELLYVLPSVQTIRRGEGASITVWVTLKDGSIIDVTELSTVSPYDNNQLKEHIVTASYLGVESSTAVIDIVTTPSLSIEPPDTKFDINDPNKEIAFKAVFSDEHGDKSDVTEEAFRLHPSNIYIFENSGKETIECQYTYEEKSYEASAKVEVTGCNDPNKILDKDNDCICDEGNGYYPDGNDNCSKYIAISLEPPTIEGSIGTDVKISLYGHDKNDKKTLIESFQYIIEYEGLYNYEPYGHIPTHIAHLKYIKVRGHNNGVPTIQIVPTEAQLQIGDHQKFTVEATYQDGTTQDVTEQALGNPVYTAVKAGTYILKASLDGQYSEATITVDLPGVDCSDYLNTEALTDNSTGEEVCDCITGFVWNATNTGCITTKEDLLSKADCSSLKGSIAKWDDTEQGVICDCPSGLEWNKDFTACIENKATQLKNADCSTYPNSTPEWDTDADGVVCGCVTGYTWNPKGTKCVPEITCDKSNSKIIYNNSRDEYNCECLSGYILDKKGNCVVDMIDCSAFKNTSPFRDANTNELVCDCISGYEWNNDNTACIEDKATQLKNTDCSLLYANSVPEWDADANGVVCGCISGYEWNPKGTDCIAKISCNQRNTKKVYNTSRDEYVCECLSGFILDTKGNCVADIVDCSHIINAEPKWDPKSSTYKCYCKDGLVYNSTTKKCESKIPDCSGYYPNSQSLWTAEKNKYECYCLPGYTWNKTRTACIDESQSAQENCNYPNARIVEYKRGEKYRCKCIKGYKWNPNKTGCIPKTTAQDLATFTNGVIDIINTLNNNPTTSTLSGGSSNSPTVKPQNSHQGECNKQYGSGANEPESYTINIGWTATSVPFKYQTHTAKDRIHIYQNGRNIFDSGCVGTKVWKQTTLNVTGGQLKVVINPLCDPSQSTTRWDFELGCPN